jgi:putative ABC transport system permease protein
MNTFSLALRNLLRNRRRSLTTLLAMTVGLVAVLLFGGYRSNIASSSQTSFVQGTGHLQIQHKDYFLDGSDNPAAYGVKDYQRIIAAVKQDPVLAPMLAVVTPTLQLGGVAGNFAAGVSRSVFATGLVPEDSNQMSLWNDYGVTSYAQPLPLVGAAGDAVVIGTGVARKLMLCNVLKVTNCSQGPTPDTDDGRAAPADIAALSAQESSNKPPSDDRRIEMLVSTAHGAPNVSSFNVIKAENKGVKALDDVYLAMSLSRAQKLIYGFGPPEVTAIIVQLKHTNQIPAAKERLTNLLASEFKGQPLEVLDFEALNPIYGQTMQFLNSVFGFTSALIGVIVLFTIGNTISTAVAERTVEIGTLRSMGLRRSGIRSLFISEAVLLGVFGSVIGLSCALTVAYLINHSGWAWIPPGYSYAYLLLVRVWQDKQVLVGGVVGMFLVTVLSAWWPANRAAKLVIVDALRYS